MEGVKKAKESE